MNIVDALAKLQPSFVQTRIVDLTTLINQFEMAFYRPLPADYSKFLAADGRGVALGNNRISRHDQPNTQPYSLDFLYGLDDYRVNLINVNNTFRGRLPPGLIAIGLSTVNQVCLDVAGLRPGSVYYWDHERELNDKMDRRPDYSNTIRLAGSFAELLDRAMPLPEDDADDQPLRVVKATFKFKLPGRD